MIYLQLFWSFMKIGFTSFGGLSMIPLISSEMIGHGWMTAVEVSDIVAIAEMTPGPLGLNCATFAGMRTAGLFGAIAANFGTLAPSYTTCLLVGIFFTQFKDNKKMQQMMVGVRPACLGLLVGVIFSLSKTNYIVDESISVYTLIIGAVDLYLLMKKKISIPLVIIISAVLGIIFFQLL